MERFLDESHLVQGLTGELSGSISENKVRILPPMPPARHPLARKLGRLLRNPRVTGDFFQTVLSVQQEVNQEIPSRQIVEDARFLLRVFGQSGQRQPASPLELPRVEESPRPVLDAAAQELVRQRSIAAALTYNMANSYGLPADAVFIAGVLDRNSGLLQ